MIFANPTPAIPVAQAAYQGVLDFNAGAFVAQVAAFKEAFARIWNRQDGVTPQQMFDQAGTNAGNLFAAANASVAYFTAMAAANGQTLANYLQPADYTPPLPYTINADGTVTVGAAPAPAAPATPPAS